MGDCIKKGNREGWGLRHKNVSEIKCSETPHSNMIEVLLASTENSLLREENTGNNIFQCETHKALNINPFHF